MRFHVFKTADDLPICRLAEVVEWTMEWRWTVSSVIDIT